MNTKKLEELRAKALGHLNEAKAVAAKAQAEGRDFTPAERKSYDEAVDAAKSAKASMDTIKADADIRDQCRDLAGKLGLPLGGDGLSKGRVGLAGKAGRQLASRVAGGMVDGSKALLPTGTVHTNVPLLPEVVELGRPSNTLLDALVALPAPGPTFSVLVQTQRDNNAAPVAEGATKPTTVLGLENVEVKLEVIAHLSEPIPRYWIADNVALERFVEDELIRGLRDAVENEVVDGNGTSPHLHGILTTSGIQTQAFATDVALSVRKAITKLEIAGHEENHLVILRPEDWEAAETARAQGSGQLEAVEDITQRAQRSLYGVPVVVSNALPLGTGLVLDREAAVVYTDSVVDVRWSETVGDDFEKNLVRARVESRYASVVTKPLGVVKVATASTP